MIKYILNLKPIVLLISIFVLQIVIFFISAILTSSINEYFSRFNITIFFAINAIPVLIWFLYVGFALFIIEKSKISRFEFNKYKFSLLIVFLNIILSGLLFDLKYDSFSATLILVNIILGLFSITAIYNILRYWVNNFVILYEKRNEKNSDYINYILLLSFYPLAVYVLQKIINSLTDKK